MHEVHTKNVFFLSEILKPRFLKYFKKNILRNHKMTIALVVNFLRLNMITFKISSKLTNVHKNLWFFLQMLNLFSNNAWFKIQDVPFFGDRSLTTLWILQRMQMLRFMRLPSNPTLRTRKPETHYYSNFTMVKAESRYEPRTHHLPK